MEEPSDSDTKTTTQPPPLSQPSSSPSIVPVTVLSIVKDNRYTLHLYNLISDAVHLLISDNNNDNSNGGNDNEKFYPEITFLATLLPFLFVHWRRGRSIGMEYVDISYKNSDDDTIATKNGNEMNLTNALGGMKNSGVYAIVYILFPYLLRRFHRNGWVDLIRFFQERQKRREEVSRENLRGTDRRKEFDIQRRRMLERAHIPAVQGQCNCDQGQSISDQNSASNATSALWDRLKSIMSLLLQKTYNANNTFYSIQNDATSTINYQNLTNSATSIMQQHDTYTSVIFWMMRLHLALFFLNGKYSDILKRVLNIRIMKQNATAENEKQLLPSYRIIGMFIFFQAVIQFMKGTIQAVINVYYELQMRRGQRQKLANWMEHKVPSSISHPVTGSNIQCSSYTIPMSPQRHSQPPCGICMAPRKYPSVASKCGHVFCWECIQHWCANVRQECPLCRMPTRLQDVIVLYHYVPILERNS